MVSKLKRVLVPVVIKQNKKQDFYVKPINKSVSTRIDTITTGLSIITNSYIDYSGYTPKKYVTECHLKPKIGPFWYSESVTLHINSTKKKYKEKIYFMNKLHPSSWSEMMTIKTNDEPKNIVSECEVYIENPEPKEHVIHLQSLPVIEV
ncbi:unnamed protein product [Acanthoscelides obtectus]|uniref:Uncharacterized protein n=1 Tax=Acanthoscelides obtectus TaxID=200917 RepID=A0A9P0PLH2_ACAOB|nr:unnamed protein product [Acanthoscelides obtectus]CAK1674421.1 hypothetical protein AOBTE_LOCUS29615 [Acanthoscelides obtectus]